MHSVPSINQIFGQYQNEYLKKFPSTTAFERKIIHLLTACRTEELGARVYKCDSCNHTEVLYNSCRNRHCPQCQNMKKEKWIHERQKEILPFTYFHVVFTLPNELNPIAYRNKKIIYKLLFDACKETLLSVGADEKYFGADIGFFSILHTWGQKLNLHPHLHCVVPGGGYSKTKDKWIKAPNNYLLPVKVLKMRFRSLFLTKLKILFKENKLFLENCSYSNHQEFQRLIDKLFAKDWVIYMKETFGDSTSVIKYLGRYTHKIAITSHRIISVENKIVKFKYRDYKDANKEKILQLDVLTFMRRFMIHIIPYRFVRIRYYGLLSHRNKKKNIEACLEFYKQKYNNDTKEFNWQDLLFKLTGKDANICSVCKKGTMFLHQTISPVRYGVPP